MRDDYGFLGYNENVRFCMERALHIFKVLSICQIRYGEMLLKVLFSLVKHIVSVESQVVLLDEVLFFIFL